MKSLKDKFKPAFHGLRLLMKDPSMRIQFTIALLVSLFAFLLGFDKIEWCVLILTFVLVLVSEAINTCIEKICDLIDLEVNPSIGRIKDMSAGFVLIVSIASVLIGAILFGTKLLGCF